MPWGSITQEHYTYLLEEVTNWSEKENEDWDGHPQSYDIIAMLSGNPLEGLGDRKLPLLYSTCCTIYICYFQCGENLGGLHFQL